MPGRHQAFPERQALAYTGIAYAFLASNAAGPSPASNQVTVTVR